MPTSSGSKHQRVEQVPLSSKVAVDYSVLQELSASDTINKNC